MKNWKQPFIKIGILPFISSSDTQHFKAHIHLCYAEQQIVLELPGLNTLAGSMKVNKLKQAKKILQDSPELVDYLINLFYEKNQ